VREPPWKSLVRELGDSGFSSPYLDRLRRRVDPAQAQQQLETEIVGEIAAALGRAGEKVDYALLRLEVASREIEEASTPRDRRKQIADFNRLRDEALAARLELRIHREAIGIRRNHLLDATYPIPPRRRA